MIQRLRKLPLPVKVLAYAATAILLLAVAAGVGVLAALMLGPDPDFSGGESQREAGSLEKERPQKAGEGKNAAEGENAPGRLSEAEYLDEVADIQSKSVEAFLNSHDKLLRYDALTAGDIEQMRANEMALQGFTDQVSDLEPPQGYGQQHEVFRSAVSELHGAAQLAYSLAADPLTATQSEFEEYDGRVNRAATLLQQSNDLLGRNHETIEGVEQISPELGATQTVGDPEAGKVPKGIRREDA